MTRPLGERYPNVFLVLGNDDARFEEATFLEVAATGLWSYAHERTYCFSHLPGVRPATHARRLGPRRVRNQIERAFFPPRPCERLFSLPCGVLPLLALLM